MFYRGFVATGTSLAFEDKTRRRSARRVGCCFGTCPSFLVEEVPNATHVLVAFIGGSRAMPTALRLPYFPRARFAVEGKLIARALQDRGEGPCPNKRGTFGLQGVPCKGRWWKFPPT